MTATLEATRLGKRYGRTRALEGCSFRLERGHVAALVGPNGAGKSTLLNLAVGLLRPTEGSMRVLGWSPRVEAELVLPRVGFVGQDVPLYGRLTVADHLRLGRELNRRWDQVACEHRIRKLGIPPDRRVGLLSGGQRAQVALTLALGKRPELILLDEPLASLDPLARRQFLQELMEVTAAEGVTVMLSSHLVADLERVCDHLVLLNGGRVQLAGGIDQLLADHRLLVGPAADSGLDLPGVEVIRRTVHERQLTLWVRGRPEALPPPWRESELSLEGLVLAYLAGPGEAVHPAGALEVAS
jgi:ABC-2 type transport system ATP-binding protein